MCHLLTRRYNPAVQSAEIPYLCVIKNFSFEWIILIVKWINIFILFILTFILQEFLLIIVIVGCNWILILTFNCPKFCQSVYHMPFYTHVHTHTHSLISQVTQTNLLEGLSTHFPSTSSTCFDFGSCLCYFNQTALAKIICNVYTAKIMAIWKLLLYLNPLPTFCDTDFSSWKFDLAFYHLTGSLSSFRLPLHCLRCNVLSVVFSEFSLRSFLFSCFTLLLRNVNQTHCCMVLLTPGCISQALFLSMP